MKPSKQYKALHAPIGERVPLHIWGACGVGKSQIVAQVADDLDFDFIDIRAVQLDPVDLRGLPRIKEDQTEWVPPRFLPSTGKGILFLDELTSAPQMTQADCYQLVLDRKLGEYVLPDGWVVIAAGNPASERGVHFSMPRPLRNRFVHLDLEADLNDWCKWAVGAGVRPEIIAFLLFKPDLLHTADATSDANAWAAIMMSDNKSWEMSGSSPWTTISEMELTAAVEALRSIPTGSSVQLFSDSELLIRGMLFHIRRWQAIEWRNSRGAPLQHQALWEELLARNEQLNIHWQWIRDHRGHPVQTRADALAYKSAQQEVHSRLLIPEDVL